MAADIKGVLTTLNHALPAGVDGGRVAIWRLRQGRTYADVRSDIANALDAINAELLTSWSDFVTITTEDFVEYPNGGSISDMPKLTDLDRPQPRKGTTIGHMIDLWRRGDGIGGSETFFRDTREAVILAALRNVVQSGRNVIEKDILTRAMTTTENQLGTSGYDVPFANGNPNSGSGYIYTPPQWGGKVFTSSHNHYLGLDSGTYNFGDLLSQLAGTVNEHGYDGPYVAYVSEADVTTYRALTDHIKFVAPVIGEIDRGGATSGAQYFKKQNIGSVPATGGRSIGYYDSGYGEIELRATNRIPTKYALLYKSFGPNDPRNPLALRVHPDVMFGFRIKEIPSFDTTWPIKEIDIEVEYGVSCGINRTIAAAGWVSSGVSTYTNPTIS